MLELSWMVDGVKTQGQSSRVYKRWVEAVPLRANYKLRPGHYMSIQPGGEAEIRKYWDAEYPDKVSLAVEVRISH